MSVKGRPQTWFEQAVRAGSLADAMTEADELRPLALHYALALHMLLGEARDRRFARAAARWLARLVLERPAVELGDVRAWSRALAALPDDPAAARRALAELCPTARLEAAARLLEPAARRPS